MESTCQPGLIQVSEYTRLLLPAGEALEATGGIEVKGKGMMQTHVWHPPEGFFERSPPTPVSAKRHGAALGSQASLSKVSMAALSSLLPPAHRYEYDLRTRQVHRYWCVAINDTTMDRCGWVGEGSL